MSPESLIASFAVPGLALAVWCAVVWAPWSAKRWGGKGDEPTKKRAPSCDRWRIAITALGALVAFAFSHRAIDGRWPVFPPTLTLNINAWMFYLAIIAALASALSAIFAHNWAARTLVRLAACVSVSAVPVLLLMQGEHSFYNSGFALDPKSGPLWIAVGAIAAFAWWSAFTPRRLEKSRLPYVLPLGIYVAIAAPTMVLWTVAINAQFLGASALALAPAGLIVLWRPHARIYDALVGFAVLITLAAIVSSYHFANEYPSPISAALLALAPLGMFLVRLRALRPKGAFKRAALATAIVAVPAIAGAGIAGYEYSKDAAPTDEDALYEGYYGS